MDEWIPIAVLTRGFQQLGALSPKPRAYLPNRDYGIMGSIATMFVAYLCLLALRRVLPATERLAHGPKLVFRAYGLRCSCCNLFRNYS